MLDGLLPLRHTRKAPRRGGYEACRLLVQYDSIGAAVHRIRHRSIRNIKHKSEKTLVTEGCDTLTR